MCKFTLPSIMARVLTLWQRSKAVPHGAISFHLDGRVSSRVSRATYGVEVWNAYDSKLPDHVKRGARGLITVHPITGEPILYGSFSVILPRVSIAVLNWDRV